MVSRNRLRMELYTGVKCKKRKLRLEGKDPLLNVQLKKENAPGEIAVSDSRLHPTLVFMFIVMVIDL